MQKDCDISSLEANDFCYKKSLDLLQKLNLNKNYCLTKDDCAISFDNLKELDADQDYNPEEVEITVGNVPLGLSCFEGVMQNSKLEDYTDYLIDSSQSNYVAKDTFTLSKTLIRPSDEDVAREKAALQNQVNTLATNYAAMTLNCTFGNLEQKRTCADIEIGANYSNKFITTGEYNSTSLTEKGKFVHVFNFRNLILKHINEPLSYAQIINKYFKDEEFPAIQNFLDYTSILDVYTNLDCTIKSSARVIYCPDIKSDSGNYIHKALNENGYSNVARVAENEITNNFPGDNYSYTLPNTEIDGINWQSANMDNFRSKPLNYVITKFDDRKAPDSVDNNLLLKYAFDGIEGINAKYKQTADESQAYMISKLSCNYGNPEVKLYCCNENRNETSSSACQRPFDDYLIDSSTFAFEPFKPGYFIQNNDIQIATTNFVKEAKNTFIVKANIDNTSDDIASAVVNASEEAIKSAMSLAYADASISLNSCGFYSHEIYMFCDHGYEYDKNGNLKENEADQYNNLLNNLYSANYYKQTGYTTDNPDRQFNDDEVGYENPILHLINYKDLCDTNGKFNLAELKKQINKATNGRPDVDPEQLTDASHISESKHIFLIYKENYNFPKETTTTVVNLEGETVTRDVSNNVNTITRESGVRLINKTNSTPLVNLTYGSFNNLYYFKKNTENPEETPSPDQYTADALAIESIFLGVSCMYGNRAIEAESCEKIGQTCGGSGYAKESYAAKVTQDYVMALDPESADTMANTIHLASAVCICNDWTGGGGNNVTANVQGGCSGCGQQYYCVFTD